MDQQAPHRVPMDDDSSVDPHDKELREGTATVGGIVETPCFGLLEGFFHNKAGSSRIKVCINKLPATLGRSNNVRCEDNFFGMGFNLRALSREQFLIEFRARQGSFQSTNDGSFTYTPNKKSVEIIGLPKDEPVCFFSITNLGKNNIQVNGRKVAQHAVSYLPTKSTVRMNHLCLYFLLPTEPSTQTMTLPSTNKTSDGEPAKKRTRVAVAASSATDKAISVRTTEGLVATILELKDEKSVAPPAVQRELARRCLEDIRRDPKIQVILKAHKGLKKPEIVDWIEKSEVYGPWKAHLLEHNIIQQRTFVNLLTKTLETAGYTRDNSFGRYIRWVPPPLDGEAVASGH